MSARQGERQSVASDRASRRHRLSLRYWLMALLWPLCLSLCACSIFSPRGQRAEVVLRSPDNNAPLGQVVLTERREGVQFTYNLRRLEPNTILTLLIHSGASCGTHATLIGPRFDLSHVLPGDASHASAISRAASRLAQIRADASGVAAGFFVLPGYTLDGVASVVGRVLVLHAGTDEWASAAALTTRPEDNAGAVRACGVIAR